MNTKRFLAALISMVMVISLLPVIVNASNGTTETIYWALTYSQNSSKPDTLILSSEEVTGAYSGTTDGVFTGTSEIPWYANRSTIKFIDIKDKISPTSTASWFYKLSNVEIITGLENIDTSNVTDMSNMFAYCSKLLSLDVSTFNTSNVTDMHNMFMHCDRLLSLNISGFDTKNVRDMSNMFFYCFELESLNVSHFNTSNVTNMYRTFGSCAALESIDVSSFDTSKVIDMSDMFYSCGSLLTLDVTGFNTENVTNMNGMFTSCYKLKSLDITNFNTSKVTNMGGLFSNCSSLESIDLSKLNTDNVTDMSSMFHGCSSLKTIDLSKFNAQNVSSFYMMLKNLSGTETLILSESMAANITSTSLTIDKPWYHSDGTECTTTAQMKEKGAGTYTKTKPVISITLNKDNVKVNNYSSGKLILASYNTDFSLLDCKIIPNNTISGEEISIVSTALNTNGASFIKAFLWSDTSLLTQLCDSEYVSLLN